MFNISEYLDQLLKSNGAGLSDADKTIFNKFKATNQAVGIAQDELVQLKQKFVAQEQQIKHLEGRGSAYAELLFDAYKANLSVRQPTAASTVEGEERSVPVVLASVKN